MHEAPANMEEKISALSKRVTDITAPWYEKATPESQSKLMGLIAELEQRMIAYRAYEIPWDSKLIETVGSIEGVKFKTQEISTFDSVMDKAREIFLLVSLPEKCDEC